MLKQLQEPAKKKGRKEESKTDPKYEKITSSKYKKFSEGTEKITSADVVLNQTCQYTKFEEGEPVCSTLRTIMEYGIDNIKFENEAEFIRFMEERTDFPCYNGHHGGCPTYSILEIVGAVGEGLFGSDKSEK